MEIVRRREIALRLAMDFLITEPRDDKQMIEVAKRFDHFLASGANARDRTLSIVSEAAAEE
jgi:hypothetical protein